MFYLFKKVYLASDNIIDVMRDRVVISLANGFRCTQGIEQFPGELIAAGTTQDEVIGSGKPFASYFNMFKMLGDKSDATNKMVVIYADNENLVKIWIAFMKLALANPDRDTLKELLDLYVYKYKVFHRGRFSRNTTNKNIVHAIDTDTFNTAWDNIVDPIDEEKTLFKTNNGAKFPIEILLATYLNNGDYKDELKGQLKNLLKKDLEKYLFELKEIFLTHMLTTRFTDKLSLAKSYDITNISDIETDSTEYPSLFFNRDIWSYAYLNYASTGKNINFENITDDHINTLKEFTNKSGESWSEENVYKQVKSDINKLDYIEIVRGTFTDELLNSILDTEATFENAAGSFFSIDLETVNHFFVAHLLQAWKAGDSTATLPKYSIT